MRRIAPSIAAVAAIAFLAAAAADPPAFVGVSKCKDCHRTERQGRQFPIWQASLHARAFQSLKSGAAGTIAAAAGVSGAPEEAPACLKCHATLHEKAPDLRGEGVTCESCHGPGSLYRKLDVMMNRDACVDNGLLVYLSLEEIRGLCLRCHAGGHGAAFDFDAAWEKIKHDKPVK